MTNKGIITKKYNVGIVGSGAMAKRMIKALKTMEENISVTALASYNEAKAASIGKKYGINKIYSSYEEMAADKEIDIVYVATVNSTHRSVIDLFLNNEKHVLCEKPMSLSVEDSEYLYNLAGEKKRFLGEGLWILALPYVRKLKELLAKKVIGDIQYVSMNIGYDMRKKERVTSPELGGGALLDIGIYELALEKYLFGDEIEDIISTVVMSDTGVDEKSCSVIKYKNNILSTLISDMSNNLENSLTIVGNAGKIYVKDFLFSDKIYIKKKNEEEYSELGNLQEKDVYTYEWCELIQALNNNSIVFDFYNDKDSIATMRDIENIKGKW